MIEPLLIVFLLGAVVADWPANLEYNSCGVAMIHGEWLITDKDGKHRFAFWLCCHNGLWYCTTQCLNPLWGYGIPLSDYAKGFPNYEDAVSYAYQIAVNHYMSSNSGHQKDIEFYLKNVKPLFDEWKKNPSLDNFKVINKNLSRY